MGSRFSIRQAGCNRHSRHILLDDAAGWHLPAGGVAVASRAQRRHGLVGNSGESTRTQLRLRELSPVSIKPSVVSSPSQVLCWQHDGKSLGAIGVSHGALLLPPPQKGATTEGTEDTENTNITTKNVKAVAKTRFNPSRLLPSCSSCPSWLLCIKLCVLCVLCGSLSGLAQARILNLMDSAPILATPR
jgi:hypothetical protein